MCFQQSQCQSNTCLQHKLWPLKACGLLGWPPGTGKAPPLAGRASYSEPKATSCTKLWIPKLRITHYLGKTQATKETGNQGDLPGTLQKHQKKKKLQEAVSTKTVFCCCCCSKARIEKYAFLPSNSYQSSCSSSKFLTTESLRLQYKSQLQPTHSIYPLVVQRVEAVASHKLVKHSAAEPHPWPLTVEF